MLTHYCDSGENPSHAEAELGSTVVNILVEIAVPTGTSSTERGRLLEHLAAEFLETQNYGIVERVRLTGVEVDLIATERTTEERIFVECKGHRGNIAAEFISKLLGSVEIHEADSGWLLSTAPLGQDARGLQDKWEQRLPAKRRKLKIYPPTRLCEHLISARLIVNPERLPRSTEVRYSEEAYLLITPFGKFWALPTLDSLTTIPRGVMLFNACSGKPILDEQFLLQVSQTDTTLASLDWIAFTQGRSHGLAGSQKLKEELQSIVRVPSSDRWADYRPARPSDFVGRDGLLEDVFQFLDGVRTRSTKTRLMALSAPSGWGKSSTILKIAANAESRRRRRRLYVHGVDCRAASSPRYPELAVLAAIRESIRDQFIRFERDTIIGGGSNPFSTDSMRVLLSTLGEQGKVICVIFDQFEELRYKEYLMKFIECASQ